MAENNALSVIQRGQLDRRRVGQSIRVLGIDLGTTNSTISEAIWTIGSAEPPIVRCLEVVQPTLQGEYTHLLLPSVVAIYGSKIFIGEGAKRLRSQASELDLKQNQNLYYECKNDIGNRRTYHRGPSTFQSASEIGGKIVDYLYKAALEVDSRKPDRVVITVPASFQAAQRQDTLKAAELAGLKPAAGDLLDEPIAAFLDYLITHSQEIAPQFAQPGILVVFDFGGGTCDVGVFRLHRPPGESGQFKVELLAVSRYHSLGGGDIDAAIVHEVLIPQLCQQNNINPLDLTYKDKKIILEPSLLGLAENLKIGLCIQIQRLKSFGKYNEADKNQVVKTEPGVGGPIRLGNQMIKLSTPKLTAAQFEKLLEPFLDQDLLFARETEYRMTCSIFAPLQDALDRAGIEPSSVDYCLAIGGSSLIPQVLDGLKAFFPKGNILIYPDRDSAKICISHGAAYHALALATFGKPFVQPICHDEIAIRSSAGLVSLIPKGVSLPYPSDGSFSSSYRLAVPKTVLLGHCNLIVDVVAASDERLLGRRLWPIPGPVNEGTPICLEYRLDENQMLYLQARLQDAGDDKVFEMLVENPLTNVVNPQPKRLKIDEIEENLRTGHVPRDEVSGKMAEIAELYADLGQREKAIEFLKRAIRIKNQPDVIMLDRLAGYYGTIGDHDHEEKFYREAAKISTWGGSWFNLSLALKRQGKLAEAADAVEQALKLDREAPFLVLGALIAKAQEDVTKSQQFLKEAMTIFGPIPSLNDWELGWFVIAAQEIGDEKKFTTGRDEQRRRSQNAGSSEISGDIPAVDGNYPKPTSDLARGNR